MYLDRGKTFEKRTFAGRSIKKEAGEGGRLSLELQVSEEPETEVMSFLGDGAYSLAFDGSLENHTLSSDGIRVWAFQVMETVERK